MSVGYALAVYFLIWWVTLFAVLPFGIRSQHEGDYVAGTDPGAPILPRLISKLVWTTVISAMIFGVIYGLAASGWFSLDDIPFLPRPKL